MVGRNTIALLIALILGHIVLACWYASVTPYRTPGVILMTRSSPVQDVGAPDERQHVNYISRLASGQGFPVFNPNDPNLYETYQSHQPPAYYLVAAAWSKLLGIQDFAARDSGLKLRILNALFGAGTVAGCFFLALWGFKREDVAIVAACFAAGLPMFVALSGAVSNDPMLICECTWALALLACGIGRGFSWRLAIGLGALTGLALMTKTTAIALLPAMLVAVLVPQKERPKPLMLAAVLGITLIIAAPWWARNQRLYGDPLAMTAFTQAFKGSAQKSDIVRMLTATEDSTPELTYWKDWVGWWTARSFFGAFGYMDIWLNEKGTATSQTPNTLYRLLLVGMLVVAAGWLYGSTRPESKDDWPVQCVNGAFLLIVIALFLRFNMQYFQAQARYVLPAMGPISCGVGIGAVALFKKRPAFAAPVVGLLLLGVNLYALSILPDAFAKRTAPEAHSNG